MAENIKFVYFNARARGELCRLVLLAAGKEFEDARIDSAEKWPPAKAEAPFGQVPYMWYKGKKYAQSIAIASFFAREFGLYGKINLEALRIDEVLELVEDLRNVQLRDWTYEKDETKKSELEQKLKEGAFPQFLGFFESLLNENDSTGFFVGNSVSLADLQVYDILDTILSIDSEAIAAFPSLKKLRGNVEAVPAIKTYLASRPKTRI